jgi:hypothetical protein
LRPLGLFSKSLSKAQQAWATWERELLAAVEIVQFYSSILHGMFCVFHTDHLNNTVMGAALKQPEKILRMFFKIESQWCTLSGCFASEK